MKKLRSVIDFNYIYIFFAISISGNMFFLNDNNIKYFIIFSIVVICRYLYLVYIDKVSNKHFKKDVLLISFIIVFILTTMITSNDIDLLSYMNIIVRFIVAYIFAKTIDYESFSKVYVNILVFLSIVSLILWGTYQLYPQIVNKFSMIYNPGFKDDFRVYVNVMFIYSYIVPFGYGTGSVIPFGRNNGIFWEPGAYQFYLGLALILLFEKYGESKYVEIILIIFSITLLSTGSSTGIITLIVIWFVYRKKIKIFLVKYYKKYNMFFIIPIIMLSYIIYKYSDKLLTAFIKLKNEIISGDAILERTGLNHFSNIKNIKELIFGKGVAGFQNLTTNCDNTYMYYVITFGIIFAIFILVSFFINYKKNFNHYIGAFIVLMSGFSSEVLVMMPIVLALLFLRSKSNRKQFNNI